MLRPLVWPKSLTGFKLQATSANIVVPCKRTQHVGPNNMRVVCQQCCARLHRPFMAHLKGCNIAQHCWTQHVWQCWIVLGALVFERSQHHQTCWIVTRAHVRFGL